MARQLRGMPLAYRMIASAKNKDRWWDAMLQRVVMETVMIGYKQGGNPSDLSDQMDALAKTVTGTTDTDTGLQSTADTKQLYGGGLFSFNNKESMQFTDLKAPSNNFDKMQEAYIDLVGMSTDIPPEVLKSKYSTSFTAHKGALNDFVKFYMSKRNTLIRPVCNIVVREIAKEIFLSGKMKMPHPAFFTDPIIQLATLSGNWLGPVPGHINPKVEVEAKSLEVENAFRTRADAAADYGNEFDNMIEEWQAQESEWSSKSLEKQAATIPIKMLKKNKPKNLILGL
jgi:capsid protein